MPLDYSDRCTAYDSFGAQCGMNIGHHGPHAGVSRENKAPSCDAVFFPANHPQDWMKDSALIRCGRAKEHEGHHWPIPVGLDVPQRANASKPQDPPCPICGEAPSANTGPSLLCPYASEVWHLEAGRDISKWHLTLHLQRRRKGHPSTWETTNPVDDVLQRANAGKAQPTKETPEERRQLMERTFEQLQEINDALWRIAEDIRR